MSDNPTHARTPPARRLPPWLKRPLGGGGHYARTAHAAHDNALHTICEEARCPNRGECWTRGTASFLILGDACTRRCGFCAVKDGVPRGALDRGEPERLAAAVERMQLKYVVVTSVDRDDLPDRGAGHFVECIRAIRARTPHVSIELLTPDFRRRQDEAIAAIAPHAPLVWGHNLETVPALYRTVRPGSSYAESLDLLRRVARAPGVIAKSSLMLGLGETHEQVLHVVRDLVAAGVRRMTLGQYLRPTPKQLPVQRYVPPEEFAQLAREARELGMTWIISTPFARSSYFAELPEDEAAAILNPDAEAAR